MSTEQNKVAVRRFIDEVFVKGNADGVEKLVTPTSHRTAGGRCRPASSRFKQAIRRVHAGLSDVKFKIDDMLAEDDKVAVRVTAHAKHQGDFMGFRPRAGSTRSPRRTSSTCATARSPNTGAMRHAGDDAAARRTAEAKTTKTT